jgi:hypothetical protein
MSLWTRFKVISGNRHPDSECLEGIGSLMPSVLSKPAQNFSLSVVPGLARHNHPPA